MVIMSCCKACNNEIKGIRNEYCFCADCGSANFLTDNSSDKDNSDYFNSIYTDKTLKLLENRLAAFQKFSEYDAKLNSKSIENFSDVLLSIDQIIINSEAAVEIGFGGGDQLLSFLQRGANIYGVDLSVEAVNNFKLKNPDQSYRVACSTKWDFPVNTVYANALFEHLDAPEIFLENILEMLLPKGQLILRLPIMTARLLRPCKDINFWKPCHRIIYTIDGITTLLNNNRFRITQTSALDYYGYRVMNILLKMGFTEIEYLRNPCYQISNLKSELFFQLILARSLLFKSACSDCVVVAEKY
jgi:SAM-dependent methyltransferase